MKLDNVSEKTGKKASKLNEKFENKLNIVELNTQLTPEEKIKLYEKMLKQLNGIEKRINMSSDITDGMISISKVLSQGSVPNFLTTALGVIGLGFGISTMAIAPQHITPTIAIGAGIATATIGSAMLANAVLNSEMFGKSAIDKLEMKGLNNYDQMLSAIINIRKHIKQEIKLNQALIDNIEV